MDKTVAVCGFVIAAGSLMAQSPGPNTPSFQSGVSMVTVPVVVRDRDGHAVSGLSKDAFQLFDKGKRQEIVSFSEESASGKAAFPNHFTAYLFDDVSTRDPADITAIQQAAGSRIAGIHPDERVAIVTTSCRVMLDFGNDAAKLNAVLADLRAAAFPLCTAQATEPLEIAVLRSLVQRMSTLPGQRSIVFVSPGFRVDNVAMPSLDRLVDSAVASKVSIHVLEVGRLSGGAGAPRSGGQLWGTESQNVIRPDGTSGEIYQPTPTYAPEPASRPWSGDQVTGVLRQIAHGTGGDFVEGGNRIDAAFRRLAPPENYYLLGFVPANLKTDDSFHPLKVTLHEKGKLTVQTRSGYYAWARPHPNGTP